jgi:poly(glycerol-phosphate) alpha-glucosyltransferase
VAEALRRLSIEVASQGHAIDVLGIADEGVDRDLPQWRPVEPVALATRGPGAVGYLPKLRGELVRLAPDVVHTHGLWKYTSAEVVRWSRRVSRPYLVSPHGMLDPWAVRNSRWKKRLALAWFESQHLRGAACIHALNEAEHRAIRSFGLTNPVCVIPNAVDLPAETPSAERRTGEGRTILFLGRLHPKKGLRELLEAWSEATSDASAARWRLAIAGWDDGGHEAGLREAARRLGVDATVDFVGPVVGDAKQDLLGGASAFILPSHSEGLPVAVLEAWSHSLPVVMTEACNLPDGFASEAAIRITPAPAGIAAGLRRIFQMSAGDLRTMGRRGRALVEERYQWPSVARRLIEVYAWLAAGGAPPDCVRHD